jgi:hypothetical protein
LQWISTAMRERRRERRMRKGRLFPKEERAEKRRGV